MGGGTEPACLRTMRAPEPRVMLTPEPSDRHAAAAPPTAQPGAPHCPQLPRRRGATPTAAGAAASAAPPHCRCDRRAVDPSAAGFVAAVELRDEEEEGGGAFAQELAVDDELVQSLLDQPAHLVLQQLHSEDKARTGRRERSHTALLRSAQQPRGPCGHGAKRLRTRHDAAATRVLTERRARRRRGPLKLCPPPRGGTVHVQYAALRRVSRGVYRSRFPVFTPMMSSSSEFIVRVELLLGTQVSNPFQPIVATHVLCQLLLRVERVQDDFVHMVILPSKTHATSVPHRDGGVNRTSRWW